MCPIVKFKEHIVMTVEAHEKTCGDSVLGGGRIVEVPTLAYGDGANWK